MIDPPRRGLADRSFRRGLVGGEEPRKLSHGGWNKRGRFRWIWSVKMALRKMHSLGGTHQLLVVC